MATPCPRVLIVDDDSSIRSVLSHICRRAGYDSEAAASGPEALLRLRHGHFDLVTMDMMMDGMDGIDAISVIQSECELPIVAISAHFTPAVRQELDRHGVRFLLEKPFGKDQAVDVFRQAMAAPGLPAP